MSPQSREHESDTETLDVFFDCFLPPDNSLCFFFNGSGEEGRVAATPRLHTQGHAIHWSLRVEGLPAAYLRTSQCEIRSKSARRGSRRVARRLDAPAILRAAGDPQGNITHLGATLGPFPGVLQGTALPVEHTREAVLPASHIPFLPSPLPSPV
ncbi:hypothetical protein E2C01_089401 [Portunus trituberculatus]|uniref:Uncharacterized protein n=1 Tax=Portunus trituberculatus TaxID=210409 RepID=A0A5B7JH33_PORTR|nr:hypothetical protein [Portunus trituberculatus]